MVTRRFKTEAEIDFIRLNYECMTIEEIMKHLNRSRSFVLNIAKELGVLKQPTWTKREDDYLINNYNIKSIEEIATALNRTCNAVVCRSGVLNIRNKSTIKEWSDDEINVLIEKYGKIDNKDLADILNRDVVSIKNKAVKLRITREPSELWREEEVELLMSNYKICTCEELQSMFPNRKYKSIISKANMLGLMKDRVYNWSFKELDFLKQSDNMTISEISKELNLPQHIVYSKVKSLGLSYIKSKGFVIGDKCKCTICNSVKEYNDRNFNLKMKKIVCRDCNKKLINIRKYKDKYNIVLDIDLMFDTFSMEEWIDMVVNRKIFKLPKEILDNRDKMFKCLRYYISKYLNINSREDLLLNSDMSYNGLTLLENYSFKHYDSINDLIIELYKEYNIKQWEFKVVKQGFFKDKNNIKEYIRWFIINVAKSDIDRSCEYAKYFTDSSLASLGYGNIIHLKKQNKYKNYYYMLNDLFGECVHIDDFNIYVSDDGTLFDSNEELIVYEYIRDNITKNIKAIGRSRKNMYENEGEKYAPDFEIQCVNKDKKVIVEYFGLYYDKTYGNKILENYKNKANRKIEYFNGLKNIKFIALYQSDLKDNFKGVREKLTSFIV